MSIDSPILQAAIESVACAGRVTRRVQHRQDTVRRITKDDRSPVTVADFAAQAVVALELRRRLGDDVLIVGEEHADSLRRDEHGAVRAGVLEAVAGHEPGIDEDAVLDAIDACNHDATAAVYWALDPVDGTKGFLRGQQYAIALARIESGRVTHGVMGCPNLPVDPDAALDDADERGVLYAAAAGAGAWEISGGDGPPDHPRPVRARGEPGDPVRVCGSVEAAHSSPGDTTRVLERLGVRTTRVRLDSQCKYAVVARGQADAYLRLPTGRTYVEKVWDHAAGMLIAEEAGAVVSDVSGAALDFGRGKRLEGNRGVVCAVPALHERLMRAIQDLGIAAPV